MLCLLQWLTSDGHRDNNFFGPHWRSPRRRRIPNLCPPSRHSAYREDRYSHSDVADAVPGVRHSLLHNVPKTADLHLGPFAPPSPREWGLVPVPPPNTALLTPPPPYALQVALHLPPRLHCYRASTEADTWPRQVSPLTGVLRCVQITSTHQLQFAQVDMPLMSHILSEHHHVILPASLHNRVSVTPNGLTCTSLLVFLPRHLQH